MTTIRLPFPISVNSAYRAVCGRSILSEGYRRCKREAAQTIQAQRARPVLGEVSIRVELVAPDKRHRDCDNPLKATLDALVVGHVIEGDSNRFVKALTVEWLDKGEPCVVHVAPFIRRAA